MDSINEEIIVRIKIDAWKISLLRYFLKILNAINIPVFKKETDVFVKIKIWID